MEQFFGSDSKYRPRPNQENRIMEKPKVNFSLEDLFKKIAQPFLLGKRIFWLFFAVLFITALGSLYHFPLSLFFKTLIGILLLAVVTFLVVRHAKEMPYTPDMNHYVGNATVTVKALFSQFSLTRLLLSHAESLLLWGVIMVLADRLFLSWFLLGSLSNILYGFGFFAMIIGIVLSFANRNTDVIAYGCSIYCVGMALVMCWNALLYGNFPLLFGVNYLFFSIIAYYVKQWKVNPVRN